MLSQNNPSVECSVPAHTIPRSIILKRYEVVSVSSIMQPQRDSGKAHKGAHPLGPHLRLCRLIAPRWRVYNADVQFTTHADKLSETKRAEKEIRDAHKKELQEKKLKTQEANPVLQCTSQHVVFHFHCTAG